MSQLFYMFVFGDNVGVCGLWGRYFVFMYRYASSVNNFEALDVFLKSSSMQFKFSTRWCGYILEWVHIKSWAKYKHIFLFFVVFHTSTCLFVGRSNSSNSRNQEEHLSFSVELYCVLNIYRLTSPVTLQLQGSSYSI